MIVRRIDLLRNSASDAFRTVLVLIAASIYVVVLVQFIVDVVGRRIKLIALHLSRLTLMDMSRLIEGSVVTWILPLYGHLRMADFDVSIWRRIELRIDLFLGLMRTLKY